MSTPIPTPARAEYVQRMIAEQEALAEKISKLDTFIRDGQSRKFQELTPLHQRLLIEQYEAMREYLKALSARIALS